jgi:hypothetical protein
MAEKGPPDNFGLEHNVKFIKEAKISDWLIFSQLAEKTFKRVGNTGLLGKSLLGIWPSSGLTPCPHTHKEMSSSHRPPRQINNVLLCTDVLTQDIELRKYTKCCFFNPILHT